MHCCHNCYPVSKEYEQTILQVYDMMQSQIFSMCPPVTSDRCLDVASAGIRKKVPRFGPFSCMHTT
jgi:hypothetical protein